MNSAELLLGREHSVNHENVDKCAFCDIISGKARGQKLLETERILSILSLEGLPLVIPRYHITDPNESEQALEAWTESFAIVARMIPVIKDVYKATGVTIASNLGKDAGQEIDHLHIHVIPRTAGDRKISYRNLSHPKNRERFRISQLLRTAFAQI